MRRVVAAFLLMLGVAHDAFAVSDHDRQGAAGLLGVDAVSVSLKNVRLGGLLVGLSEILDRNVVVGGLSSERFSLEGDYADADELFKAVYAGFKERHEVIGGVDVVRPRCIPPVTAAFNPFSDKPAAIETTYADPVAVLAQLDAVSATPLLRRPLAPSAPGHAVGVRVDWRVPARVTYEAMVRATGLSLEQAAAGELGVKRQEACPVVKLQAFKPSPDTRGGVCPRVARLPAFPHAQFPCEPLEWYPLSDVKVLGWVHVGFRQSALVETADGLTWVVDDWARIGYDMGHVDQIDAAGVTLKELHVDAAGQQVESTRVLPYEP